jgi:Zn finger protein HypA/HybF involved in hydrogenase expression
MSEHKYYCRNCDAEIKPTDTVCPKCGKNLSEVGRRVLVTVTDTLTISDSVSTELTKEQANIIKRILRAIRRELAKKEIDSITVNFGIISFTIKNKKKTN